ncbi:Spermidine/putrescine import ATP-binding protein PotA [Oceanobacillus oncorhynchi]|uniref:Spermidine/putrescine import ATP-binding protein PotA n=1 Tax=Oceanobacillus oncorhynchi TaxID=545501 RepID=A0A0A1M547_9BACI|nr:ABC transporter ATP-binding protein [Oceanobacillus oncorhynchi]CEI80410.1 Spermidine/putrescine import ATP-binding protein PotA [Oceanobacillus oncorhynchi]
MNKNESNLSTEVIISNLYKQFGDIEVLKDIDFTIKKGEFFTLLGPSGCGKTTLLRCIAGFEKPTKGKIFFGDDDITKLQPWEKNIGFVFQNYALWPHMTVYENIAYGLKVKKMNKAQIDKLVDWSLDIVNLSQLKKSYPTQLSGGQQQRVSIARVLVLQPKVLLFDEPLSNLDAKLRVKMRKDIKELQERLGISAIYVTHDQEEALEMSDRIAVFDKGRVAQIGTPEEIYEQPDSTAISNFVGKSNNIQGTIKSRKFYAFGTNFIPLQSLEEEDGDRTLVFRPEKITIADAPSVDTFEVIVKDASYRGNYVQIEVSYNDEVYFIVETREKFEVNEKIHVCVEKYILFEKE